MLSAAQIVQGYFCPAFGVTTEGEVQDFLPEVNLGSREELMLLIPEMIADPQEYQVQNPEYLQMALDHDSQG